MARATWRPPTVSPPCRNRRRTPPGPATAQASYKLHSHGRTSTLRTAGRTLQRLPVVPCPAPGNTATPPAKRPGRRMPPPARRRRPGGAAAAAAAFLRRHGGDMRCGIGGGGLRGPTARAQKLPPARRLRRTGYKAVPDGVAGGHSTHFTAENNPADDAAPSAQPHRLPNIPPGLGG